MINNLKISNFRCFDNFYIQGFEQINLFGGKNNSGKTALLESLYLGSVPSAQSIMRLRQIRSETYEFLKAIPEKAWDNLFFNNNEINKKIEIITKYNGYRTKQIEIDCDDSVEQFSEILREDNDDMTKDIDELKTMLIESEYKSSALNIYTFKNGKKSITTSMIASSKGIISKNSDITIYDKANFIPAFLRISNSALAEEFDKSDLEGNADEVLKAIKIIDKSIDQIKTLNIGKPAIYLKRKNKEFLPITLFGEAISRVAQFILRIINNRNGILLIDEIENGIHYTNQCELWRMLFKLSAEFNIQIFATTHSYEMIKSFSEVAYKEKDCTGAYFEIARDVRKAKIVGIKREPEILKYELFQGMELRGE